jgi:hypothetical protein
MDDLQSMVEEFRIWGKFLGAIISTFIALISKGNDPSSFDECKPISLCNLFYTLISKIIINRLKEILQGVIYEEKIGFMFNRQIHDVVGTTHEELHTIKT